MASAFSTFAPSLEVVVDSEEEECVWSNSSTSSESDLVSNLATRVCPADSTTNTSVALAVAAKELAFGKLLHERQCASSTSHLSFLKQQPPHSDFIQDDLCCSALLMKQACLERLFAASHHQLANLWPTNNQHVNWNQIQLVENVAASNALLSAASMAQQCDNYSLHNPLPKSIPVQSTNSCFSTPTALSLQEHSLKKCIQQISPEPQCRPEQASSATKTNSLQDTYSNSSSTDIFLNSLSKNKLGRTYNPGRPLGMQDRRKILQLYQKALKFRILPNSLESLSCVSKIMTRYRRTGSMNPKTQLSRKMSVCSATNDGSPVAKLSHASSSALSSSCSINGSQFAQGWELVNGKQVEMRMNVPQSLFMPQASFTSFFNGFNKSATHFDSPQLHRMMVSE
uniref:Paired domain-containing protein n=1 Tax=Ditylenchus dipsaci TaxID=166011 RepID=A0A915DMJ4_9BILA